jgi:hypothetical protein
MTPDGAVSGHTAVDQRFRSRNGYESSGQTGPACADVAARCGAQMAYSGDLRDGDAEAVGGPRARAILLTLGLSLLQTRPSLAAARRFADVGERRLAQPDVGGLR